jgi:MoxR-like ATPase
MITTAKIFALLQGRYNVSFEDIKKVAYPALCHRIFLNFEALAENVQPEDIIEEIVKEG